MLVKQSFCIILVLQQCINKASISSLFVARGSSLTCYSWEDESSGTCMCLFCSRHSSHISILDYHYCLCDYYDILVVCYLILHWRNSVMVSLTFAWLWQQVACWCVHITSVCVISRHCNTHIHNYTHFYIHTYTPIYVPTKTHTLHVYKYLYYYMV